MGLFGIFSQSDSKDEIKEYLNNGAIVLDVRTDAEWNEGHLENSKHIVLSNIPLEIEEIQSWEKPIITVCKSGGRSGQACQFLNQNGINTVNGGPWQNVAGIIEEK